MPVISVIRHSFVDMPDFTVNISKRSHPGGRGAGRGMELTEEPSCREGCVIACTLTVLEEEIFVTSWVPVCPHTMDVVGYLHVLKSNRAVVRLVDLSDPPLLGLAPCGRMTRPRPGRVSTERSSSHNTPVSDPWRAVVCIIQIGPSK
jgi:hypothetical protein